MRGLSPRVRGNPTLPLDTAALRRSIPACAGEPRMGSYHCRRTRVYPRVCGGTSPAPPITRQPNGLSPRVRGNRIQSGQSNLSPRSIPACAGEPASARHLRILCEVYPRVCGGTITPTVTTQSSTGLSPRVRGNPESCGTARRLTGSIPACAGEPSLSGRIPPQYRVYPRVCGGTGGGTATAGPSVGLSPRVRGNRPASIVCRRHSGSIPACAGEPFCITSQIARTKVYPRVCGGTHAQGCPLGNWHGLSPRVRGNP